MLQNPSLDIWLSIILLIVLVLVVILMPARLTNTQDRLSSKDEYPVVIDF